jgi:SAM-dependent methyltransferase
MSNMTPTMPEPASLNPEFDAFAEDYDAALNKGLSVSGEDKNYFARGRLLWLRGRLGKLGFPVKSAMDFGCGTGSATPFFLETFPETQRFIGTDISDKSLSVARRHHADPRVSFHLMDDYAPSRDLDLVFCNGVFHHIPLDQRDPCAKYIHDSLRPAGLFAMFENNPWNPGTRYVMSKIPFDKDAVTLSPPESKRLLRRAGFTILRQDSLFYFPRLLRALRPLEPLLAGVPLGTQYLTLARRHS